MNDSVPKNKIVLPVHLDLGGGLHLADLLGGNLEFWRVPKHKRGSKFHLRDGSVHNFLPHQSTSKLIQLGVIVILFLMEPECKLAIKNFVGNARSVVSANPVNDTPYWYD